MKVRTARKFYLELVLSSTILDPRVGRFMDKSTPLSSVSRLLQQVFKRHSGPFFHVVHPSHPWLPLSFVPGLVPCMTSFSRQSLSFLITCPKYDNFLLLIMLSSSRSISAVSNTHPFVFFCVHDTLRILRMHFISKA